MPTATIAVTALIDEQRSSYWMLPGYMEGLLEAGALPLMLPPTADEQLCAQLMDLHDGLLLTGGQDVDPALYGERPRPECGPACGVRDAMELQLLRRALVLGRPVLAICRGLQLLNVALGGTLYQDLPSQHPSALTHHQAPPYDRPAHEVDIVPATPLHALLDMRRLAVNSYHHQAICTLAPPLRVMARAGDGVIEAVWLAERPFVWGVQWHPEYAYRTSPACLRILQAFTAACTQVRSGRRQT